MRIEFLRENALESLRENIAHNYKSYFNRTNEWIYEFYTDESPFVDSGIVVQDFKLAISADKNKPHTTDVENAKILYSAMVNLTEVQAGDERLWSGLAHGQLWNYMQYRWHSGNKKSTEQNIKSRFFFAQDARRSLFVNSLSKLWWICKLVYDEKRQNPFELLSFFERDFTTKVLMFPSSNFSSSHIVTRAMISVFKEYQDEGFEILRPLWEDVLKYINAIGGTYILDYFTEEEISDKVRSRIEKLIDSTTNKSTQFITKSDSEEIVQEDIKEESFV